MYIAQQADRRVHWQRKAQRHEHTNSSRWRAQSLSFAGSTGSSGCHCSDSVLRDDFRPDSDVDVLVSFTPDARWGLFDLVHMEDELAAILGRKVDLVEREAVERSENYIRRRHILESEEPVYVAG